MAIILSQKIDIESPYEDVLFSTYHFPSRYRNQIKTGDVFVYYQGNRYNKSHRYYFGTGRVGDIVTTDGENYYAKLFDCKRFENIVPIYLSEQKYIEELGYETVRNKPLPPWQSSIRPISDQAVQYILNAAGSKNQVIPENSIEELNLKLQLAVREYFINKKSEAILKIESIASQISALTSNMKQK